MAKSWIQRGRELLQKAEVSKDAHWRGHIKYELYLRALLWILLAAVREMILIRDELRKANGKEPI